MGVHEAGPGTFVVGIRIAGADAGPAFHDDFVAATAELADAAGEQRDTVFLFFDFLRYANDHRYKMLSYPVVVNQRHNYGIRLHFSQYHVYGS